MCAFLERHTDMCTPCWGVMMCTIMYFLLLAKSYSSRFVYCDVARSDWLRGDTFYPYINTVSQLYWQITFNDISSVPINLDTLNRVILNSVIKKSQPTSAASICYNMLQKVSLMKQIFCQKAFSYNCILHLIVISKTFMNP